MYSIYIIEKLRLSTHILYHILYILYVYYYFRDLSSTGYANGVPGRHIFRMDEKVLPGVCIRDLSKSIVYTLGYKSLKFILADTCVINTKP